MAFYGNWLRPQPLYRFAETAGKPADDIGSEWLLVRAASRDILEGKPESWNA